MADNYFKGKYLDGTFNHGEGPVAGISISNEPERKGKLNTEFGLDEAVHPKTVDGTTTFKPATGDDGLFSLHSKSYAGPQNFQPANHGVSHPFDINKG